MMKYFNHILKFGELWHLIVSVRKMLILPQITLWETVRNQLQTLKIMLIAIHSPRHCRDKLEVTLFSKYKKNRLNYYHLSKTLIYLRILDRSFKITKRVNLLVTLIMLKPLLSNLFTHFRFTQSQQIIKVKSLMLIWAKIVTKVIPKLLLILADH